MKFPAWVKLTETPVRHARKDFPTLLFLVTLTDFYAPKRESMPVVALTVLKFVIHPSVPHILVRE
jgi:hypothetical protein